MIEVFQSRTDFNVENDLFGDEANEAVIKLGVYKEFHFLYYGTEELIYKPTSMKIDNGDGGVLDGSFAIDQLIFYDKDKYTSWALRFRSMDWWQYKDEFTLTFMNPTGEKSEWFKLGVVEYILYGFYDQANKKIKRWLIVDAKKLNECKDKMLWRDVYNKKKQQFKAIHVRELMKYELIKGGMYYGYGSALRTYFPPSKKELTPLKKRAIDYKKFNRRKFG
jgi:hypothetical protein